MTTETLIQQEDRDAAAIELEHRKADLVCFAKLIFKLDATVSNLVTGLEDEGDRVYLGSTNDADQLRELSGELEDAFYSTELAEYSKGYDVWAEMRTLQERIAELEAEIITTRQSAYAAGIEDAAKVAENYGRTGGRVRPTHKHVAKAIRALGDHL